MSAKQRNWLSNESKEVKIWSDISIGQESKRSREPDEDNEKELKLERDKRLDKSSAKLEQLVQSIKTVKNQLEISK